MRSAQNPVLRIEGKLLWLPLAINAQHLTSAQIDQLLEVATGTLGARYFRDRSLFMSVLEDRFKEAADPWTFLAGPYISLFIRPNGELGITACEKTRGGEAVYSFDQFIELTSRVPENARCQWDELYKQFGVRSWAVDGVSEPNHQQRQSLAQPTGPDTP